MSRLRITHTTSYRYSAPVAFGRHRLVLRPREGHDVQVESQDLRIQPAARTTWHRDLFGNSIALVHFQEESDFLEIRNEVTVFRRDLTSHRGLVDDFPVKLPAEYPLLENPLVQGYLAPVYPGEFRELGEWVRATFSPGEGQDGVQLVHELCTWIYRSIKYRRREDRGVQTPLETLRLQSGSCRDMATLLLETARALRLAARFASGYLDSAASAAGRAATHAWMEVYFPEHGWFGYDPTLGEGTSHKHILTGVSSHPRGVMPVSGAFSGPKEACLGMTVTVKMDKDLSAERPHNHTARQAADCESSRKRHL